MSARSAWSGFTTGAPRTIPRGRPCRSRRTAFDSPAAACIALQRPAPPRNARPRREPAPPPGADPELGRRFTAWQSREAAPRAVETNGGIRAKG